MEDTMKMINLKLDYLIDLIENQLYDLERDKDLQLKWQEIEAKVEYLPRNLKV